MPPKIVSNWAVKSALMLTLVTVIKPCFSACTVVTISGGRDTVTCTGVTNESYILGAGNDIINITSGATLIGDQNLGGSNDRLINDGTLDGNINFGDSDDTYITTSGTTVTGDLIFGDGRDRFTYNGGTIGGVVSFANGRLFYNNEVNINADFTKDIAFSTGRDTLNIASGVTLTGDQDLGSNTSIINVFGTLDGDLTATNAVLTIDNGGDITGAVNISSISTININSDLTQDLSLTSGRYTITLASGITLTGDQVLGNDSDTFNNQGTVDGNFNFGGGRNVYVHEMGSSITGDLIFGSGRDTFTYRGGIIGGVVDLGYVTNGENIVNLQSDFDGSIIYAPRIGSNTGLDRLNISSGVTVTGDQNLLSGNNSFNHFGTLIGDFSTGGNTDTVVLDGATVVGTVALGSGNDSVTINGDTTITDWLITEDGNDTITIASGVSFTGNVNMGNGNDVYTSGMGTTITGNLIAGSGNDRLTLNGGTINGAIDVGSGGNTVTINGDTMITNGLSADAGIDTLTIASGVTLTANVNLGDGDDVYVSGVGTTINGNLELGGNNDSLTFGGGFLNGVVDLGTGNDTANINGDTMLNNSLIAGEGNDTLTTTSGTTLTGNAELGAGVDSVNQAGTIIGDLDLGDGDDTYLIDLALGSMTGLNDGGAGIDTFQVDTSNGTGTYTASILNYEQLNILGGNTASLDNETINFFTDVVVNDAGTGIEIGAGTTLSVSGSFAGDSNDNVFVVTGHLNGALAPGGGSNSIILNSGGSIEGDLTLTSGIDTIVLNGGTIVGNITDATPTASASNVLVNGDFTTSGDITTSTLNVTAGNTLFLRSGDTINLDSQSGGTGTLQFEVDANGAVGTFNATGLGQGINLTGLTLGALVDTAAVISNGEEILLGTGNAPVTGISGSVGQTLTEVSDNILLLDFFVADGGQADVTSSGDNTDLFLLVEQLAHSSLALSPNGSRLGEALDQLDGTSNEQMSQILTASLRANTREEFESILQKMLPTIDQGTVKVVQNVTGGTLRLIADRLMVLRDEQISKIGDTGISSGDVSKRSLLNTQSWAQVFGQRLEQNRLDNIAGFNANVYGLTLGVDTNALSDDLVFGTAYTYAQIDVNSDNANNTQTDLASYSFSIYGDYNLSDDAHLIGSIGYTYANNQYIRKNVGGIMGLNAEAEYGSHQTEARLIVANDFGVKSSQFKISPQLQIHYIFYQSNSIEETGAGGASLTIDSESMNVFEIGAGLNMKYSFELDDGGMFSPEFSAGYRYDILGEPIQTTSTFNAGGPSFRSQGADPAKETTHYRLSLGYAIDESFELAASYTQEGNSTFRSHTGLIRMAYKF